MDRFLEERAHFPLLQKVAYFETAATAPIPDYVYEGVKKFQDDRFYIGGDADWQGKGTLAMMSDTKELLGKMLGCCGDDIAFGTNSSQMFTLFSEGIGLQAGDNVVLAENAWISNRFTFQTHEANGVELRYAPLKEGRVAPEDLMALVDGRTKALCVSLVESSTGYRQHLSALGEFCRAHSVWFAVDGVQGIGVLPIDVAQMKVDFMAGNDYKWMLHYCGTGFAYISKPLQKALKPWGAGWMSDDERFNTQKKQLRLRPDAGRFELGYPNVSGIYALGLVAARYLALGAKEVEERVLSLVEYIAAQAPKYEGVQVEHLYVKEERSGIIALLAAPSYCLSTEALRQNGVAASVRKTEEGFLLRLSVHYYNTTQDVDRLLHAMALCKEEAAL